jgi:spore maturation protein CgeB
MKILFLDTYYPKFIKNFEKNNQNISGLTYKKYKEILLSSFFGTSDFYSYNLKKLGYQADDIILNDEALQRRWAKENNIEVGDSGLISKLQTIPYMYRLLGKPKWVQEIALSQIKKYHPEVVYMQDLSILDPQTLKEVKKYCKLLVGQIASPVPPKEYLKCFDLIITSFPHFLDKFSKLGIKSEYQGLAFEPRVLEKIKKQKRIYDVSFVGSFTPYHAEGTKIIEEVARRVPVHVWGQGIEYLSPFSPIRKNYHGEAWGLDMYRVFAQSKIVINRHISVAGSYANNMRLYEATGMGAMLITDEKRNMNEIFKINNEAVTYKSADDLVKKIRFYLKNDREREKVANAGQKRTLKDYNYINKMGELVKIIKAYL